MYEEKSEAVEEMLKEMASAPLKKIITFYVGMQFKLIVEFQGGAKAMLKPMRFPRNLTVNIFNYCSVVFLSV